MPAPGHYTPRRSRTGGSALCEENKSVRWSKPPRESSVGAKDEGPPVGAYTPLFTQTMSEGPRLTFTTTPRTTSLKQGGVDTPAPAAYGIPSLSNAPRTAFCKADRNKENGKRVAGKKFMLDAIGVDSPGPAWYEKTPERMSDHATPSITIGRAEKSTIDKQYSGGGSNFINDGGGYNKSLTHLGPGSHDLAKSTLSPRGAGFSKSQRPEFGAGVAGPGASSSRRAWPARFFGFYFLFIVRSSDLSRMLDVCGWTDAPGPASYTPTVKSAFDRPGYSIAGSNSQKSSTAEVPGPGAYLDPAVQSMKRAYAQKPAVSFTKSSPSPRQVCMTLSCESASALRPYNDSFRMHGLVVDKKQGFRLTNRFWCVSAAVSWPRYGQRRRSRRSRPDISG